MPLTPMATREKIRSRFHGSHDLIHRLFVCISGMTWTWDTSVGTGRTCPRRERTVGLAQLALAKAEGSVVCGANLGVGPDLSYREEGAL